jgi:MOSC domain-containing protein YiiM
VTDALASRVLISASHQVIRQLYISAGHNFFGHHGRPAGKNAIVELPRIECVAGRGIRGDRFFDHRENYKGQITFFAFETYLSLCNTLNVFDRSPAVFRRNVITESMDLNALIGEEFTLQDVRFRGVEECRPCHWMNEAFGAGAEEFLRGRGGLRAMILSDGNLYANSERAGYFERAS